MGFIPHRLHLELAFHSHRRGKSPLIATEAPLGYSLDLVLRVAILPIRTSPARSMT